MPLKVNVKKFSRSKKIEPIEQIEEKGIAEQEPEIKNIIETNDDYDASDELDNEEEEEKDDFLTDLTNDRYVEPPTQSEVKEKEKQQKEIMKERMKMEKEREKQEKEYLKQLKQEQKKETKFINILESNNDLFSDTPTEIVGKEKRELINKITQYRNLFPKELAKFKVKKNCNVEELKAYLIEAESIVECSSVDGFITDSILQCIKLVEIGSNRTRFNISGCADALKANPKFHSLLKQLYCKYGCFNKIPAEYQLMMMVSTTSYMCMNKNRNKASFEQYLNQPMEEA